MSQPSNRGATVPQPGKLDASLREFWVNNPWKIVAHGHNLSAFERNRAFLNVKGQDFLDISHLTGADSDGDGRAVVAADFRNVGMLDLIVRQAGGGPLLLFENRLPRKHYLEVSLRGDKSNRQGVGARLTAVVRGQQLVRELYPANSYFSQAPHVAHFGLGDAAAVDRLTIRWPSGKVQVLADLKGDRHVVVDESKDGADAVETVVPGRTVAP
ncbi:MAG TPA: ASPIC/UnbV domain-containing protein [Gemmataceae bacterium]|nr:ASPIC/UnbV domain-containing protein [Gemmataceae bacterium]